MTPVHVETDHADRRHSVCAENHTKESRESGPWWAIVTKKAAERETGAAVTSALAPVAAGVKGTAVSAVTYLDDATFRFCDARHSASMDRTPVGFRFETRGQLLVRLLVGAVGIERAQYVELGTLGARGRQHTEGGGAWLCKGTMEARVKPNTSEAIIRRLRSPAAAQPGR